MSNVLNDYKKWTDLKEYLEVYGDFIFKNPRLTDEIMAEYEIEYKNKLNTEDELRRQFKNFLFSQEEWDKCADDNETGYFINEKSDDIIKEVIEEMVEMYRQRRHHELNNRG